MEPEEVLKKNKKYLDSRFHEKFCDEHGLMRYENGIFFGCFLCKTDKEIGDEIGKINIGKIKDESSS